MRAFQANKRMATVRMVVFGQKHFTAPQAERYLAPRSAALMMRYRIDREIRL